MVGRLLQTIMQRPFPQSLLRPFEPFRYREYFARTCTFVGVGGHGFTPYSFRRGGASHDFSIFLSFERTMSRGRWAALKTARIYVQEATLALTELQFSPEQLRVFEHFARLLQSFV
jgi:hypothetical protein